MNIVFFAALVLLIGGGVKGYKRGMVEEVNSTIALLLALGAISMFLVAAKGYLEHETLRTILGIVCMTIAILVYKIVDFILSSLRMIFAIPVIRGMNKLMGFGVGVLEAVLLIWGIFIVIVAFEFGGISEYILTAVKENLLLSYLFQNNWLAKLLSGALPVLNRFSELSGITFS